MTAYLEFPEGATGVFVTSTGDAPGTNRLELTLEYGKLVYEEDRLTLHRLAENERDFCKGIRGLTLSNAMHLSSWLGRAVALPFDEDLFLSELEKRCASSQEKQARDVVFDTKGTY